MVSGVAGYFPAVEERTDRTLTLVYNYIEGGGLWDWVVTIAEYGTTNQGKKDIIITTLDENLAELSTENYHRCFPVRYEQFTGFAQDIQTKERVIIHCGYSQPAP